MMLAAAVIIVVGGGIAAASYLLVSSGQVSIDKSQIEAPQVDLAPTVSGVLQNIFVISKLINTSDAFLIKRVKILFELTK